MSHTIDLGSRTFHAQISRLSLTLSGSVELSLSTESLKSENLEKIEQLLLSREIWVAQAPELSMYICISMQPGLLVPHSSTLFSHLGDIICNARLWSDLGLIALFKSCDHVLGPENDSTTFCLSIGFRRRVGPSMNNAKVWRLPAAVRNFNEAEPPANIPTTVLSSVNVSLEYTFRDENSEDCPVRTNAADKPSKPKSVEVDMDDFTQDSGDLIDAICLDVGGYSPELNKDPETTDNGINGSSDFEWELQDSNEEWPVLPLSPPEDYYDPLQLKQDFHKLFDITLRSLIASDLPKFGTRIKKSTNDSLRSLSEIAPAVFSLGYRDAINQRSQFIPSIAKSLASILGRTNSPILQQKISALRRLHPREEEKEEEEDLHTNTNTNTESQSQTADTRTILKTCLWKIAQRDLYKPGASRKLPSLEDLSDTMFEDEKSSISMLDTALLFETSSIGEGMYMDEEQGDNCYNSDNYLGTDDDEEDEDDFKLFEGETSLTGEESPMISGITSSTTEPPESNNLTHNKNFPGEWSYLDFRNDNDNDNTNFSHHDLDIDLMPITDSYQPRSTEEGPLQHNTDIHCAQSLFSDTEMLTSDPFEENLAASSPVLFAAGSVSSVESLQIHGCDDLDEDMLCEQL